MLKKSLIVLLLVISTLAKIANNVCNSFEDYLHYENNTNCRYNPDIRLKTPELIKKYAGVFESYEVTTEDGYILSVFRIPRKHARGVIFMRHPLLVDSSVYLRQGNESLAILLWRAGYDIWLNNQRGTFHSEKHINLTVSDKEYWNFSLHELGKYDLPSEINLVKRETGSSKIIFFGHSLGTTGALIYSTLLPKDAEKSIQIFILAGTASFFKYNTNLLLQFLTTYRDFLTNLYQMFGLAQILPPPPFLQMLEMIFRTFPGLLYYLNLLLSLLAGWTPDEMDPAFLNLESAYMIRSASIKLIVHYTQIFETKGRFQMYDYGAEINRKMYGTDLPTLYPFENISVPTYLISSTDDSITTLEDSDLLYELLPENVKKYGRLHISGLNHNDFHFGKHRKELFYDPLLNFIKTFNN